MSTSFELLAKIVAVITRSKKILLDMVMIQTLLPAEKPHLKYQAEDKFII